VTSPDVPPTSRRALREQAARRAAAGATSEEAAEDAQEETSAEVPAPAADVAAPVAEPPVAEPPVTDPPVAAAAATDAEWLARAAGEGADAAPRVALAWVDANTLPIRRAPDDLAAASSAFVPVLPDLLPGRRTGRRRGRGVALTVTLLLVLLAGYTAATQLWSLDAVVPVAEDAELPVVAAPESSLSWPDAGVAAVGVEGVEGAVASSDDATAIASITKLVTVLMVLDQRPLAPGEQGEERDITYADRTDYWSFLGRGESAINVPVGGTLTQYQLMQGTLIASAGNYAVMLAEDLWPTDAEFAAAARDWLDEQGLSGITVVEPTGIDRGNTADAASLIRLAEIALADPVVAEIVGTRTAEIPGVGEIENTNPLLTDESVVGIKTGGLNGHYNLLAAKDAAAGEETVRVYAVVLGQPSEALRAEETADLLDRIAEEATVPQTLPAGTTVAVVTTPWGSQADLVTAADAAVLLWNGETATVESEFTLDDARASGDAAGTLTLTGPLNTATSAVTLSGDLGAPDGWWRFTHPLELFGFAG
jgi:D-alanyl-D-alanine carboxypeptidase (penicillin-binding protein 5/6)